MIIFKTLFFATILCFSPTDANVALTRVEETKPIIRRGEKIILLGDSLAEGMASPFVKLNRKNGYAPGIQALHGTTIDYWSKRIQKIMLDNRPKLVIISLGTNDAGSPKPEIQRIHVKKIRDVVKQYDAKLLWIVPMNLPQRFKGQQGIKKILLEELSVSDRYDSTKLELEKTKDKIHLTRKGYEDWIGQIWTHLTAMNYVVNN